MCSACADRVISYVLCVVLYLNDDKIGVGYLCDAAGASPVPLGDLVEWGDEAEGVVAVVTAIAQQHAGLLVPATTHHAHDLVNLKKLKLI